MISKLKAKRGFTEDGGGIVKLRLSEAATVALTLRRTRGSSKARVKLSYTGVAGKNKLPIKPGKLGAGRYKVKAIATDAAGNRSKPARTKLVVNR